MLCLIEARVRALGSTTSTGMQWGPGVSRPGSSGLDPCTLFSSCAVLYGMVLEAGALGRRTSGDERVTLDSRTPGGCCGVYPRVPELCAEELCV